MATNILEEFEDFLGGGITIQPGMKGVFDVILDGNLIFSKKKLDRHAEPGEVEKMLITLIEGE